jgi:hypothetical protein
MTEDNQIDMTADPYAHLAPVLADSADEYQTIEHQQDPPVKISRTGAEANLWCLIVDGDGISTFRGDGASFSSTSDLGFWIDSMVEWWTAEEEPQPPGFDRGGSAFR